MSLLVHILAGSMREQNSRGFLFPLLCNRHRLSAAGVRIRKFHAAADRDLSQCDVLLVDGKAFEALGGGAHLLALWRKACPVGYFDLSDSATWLQAELVPQTTLYFKNQLVRDLSCLQQPLYGHRLYTDYYYRTEGITDSAPAWSRPLPQGLLDRLRVGWNAGLTNYTMYGPRLAALYDKVPLPWLLHYPRRFRSPSAQRTVAVSCRMNTRYVRRTVAHQRLRTIELLQRYAPAQPRISKFAYFRELRSSRMAVSPFGWGEINQKDFECLLSGTAIVKPDMAHLETWPHLFDAGQTYVAHKWDMSDLVAQVERFLGNPQACREIAAAGQERYRHLIATEQGRDEFTERVVGILHDLRRRWDQDRQPAVAMASAG